MWIETSVCRVRVACDFSTHSFNKIERIFGAGFQEERCRIKGGAGGCNHKPLPGSRRPLQSPDMGIWRMVAIGWALGLATAASAAVDSTIPKLSEFKDGHWQIVEGPATQPTAVESDPQIDEIERILSQGRYKEAKARLIPWLKFNRASAVRDRALYLMSDAQYGLGDRFKAFYYLDELLDHYPESPLFYTALNRQYQIADGFLNGYKRKVLIFHIGAERLKCCSAFSSGRPVQSSRRNRFCGPLTITTPILSSTWPLMPMALTCGPIRAAR
jgi:hypothetical protein